MRAFFAQFSFLSPIQFPKLSYNSPTFIPVP
ncbi:Uncharacterised protein [Vibrio cholerae]|nr:Uncharacterised protein [Vibrio cholerae]